MAVPQTTDAGKTVELRFFIPVEQVDRNKLQPMGAVEIEVPSAFNVEKVLDAPGWQSAHDRSRISFSGSAPPNTEAEFAIRGTFEKRGVYSFPVRTRSADGHEVLWRDQLTQASLQHGRVHPAPTVWVGVPRVIPAGPTTTVTALEVGPVKVDEDEGARPIAPVLIGGLGVIGAVAAAVTLKRRRAA